jgi:hypothetical protein
MGRKIFGSGSKNTGLARFTNRSEIGTNLARKTFVCCLASMSGVDQIGTRINHEKDRSDHQAVQTGRGQRSAA